MMKHIVVFKFNDGVEKDDPLVTKAFEALRALGKRIPLIRQWEVGENVSDRPAAMDYALYSAFDSGADLAAYVDDPAHREVVELLKQVCTWKVCDYET
jgi:hypothetical protein